MKVLAVLLVILAVSDAAVSQDRTITRVVKLLEEMLAKSKTEGDEEHEVYAKFKCFCDSNEEEKKTSISELGKQINILSSKIEELQGSTGGLSTECAQLRSSMMANENARAESGSIRDKEHAAFVAEEEDMTLAIGQMDEAINTLSEIGADQTLGNAAADNNKFMAGFEGMELKKQVKQALLAASSLLSPKQSRTVNTFLQAKAPFTGTYTAQSGQIVGILKNMRDTFKSNLAGARIAEEKALEAYKALSKTLTDAYAEMSESYGIKQESLGGNDEDLAAKKTQLSEAKSQKASDEEFLEKLLVMCEDKAKEYQQRKMLRANEDAAIAEAISILNSDAAFESFGKTSATSTGAISGGAEFIQLRSSRVRVHTQHVSLQARIQTAVRGISSPRVQRVASMIQAGNPFDVVLAEIDKMLELIVKEGQADTENLNWCNTERTENDANLLEANNQIDTLNGEIETLVTTIDDPESGLKAQIKETEVSLDTCVESQKTETKDRREANLLYQEDIKNLVTAEKILDQAIKVLRKYYDNLEEKAVNAGFIQKRQDQAPPSTWGGYEGQSGKGGDVISMLEFIHEETVKEETEAHSDEETAQHDYEDSMTALKTEEAELEKSLAELQQTLAEKEEELFNKRKEHTETTKEKIAIENYLQKIKPGCDFITEHFDEREANRATETTAMNDVKTMIKDTPAYLEAENTRHEESFGDCQEKCVGNEEHVECKACMAKTSIPGYCAGHAGTLGC